MTRTPAKGTEGSEFHRAASVDHGVTCLTVEISASGHNPWVANDWCARVWLADATVREFASPFELARFLARPIASPPRRNTQSRVRPSTSCAT